MKECKINLGDEVKHIITGFKGIVVARTEWLNGCWRITVQSKKLKEEGTPTDNVTFDDAELIVLVPHKIKMAKKVIEKKVEEERFVEPRHTGGPMPMVRRAVDPR